MRKNARRLLLAGLLMISASSTTGCVCPYEGS